MRDPFLIDPEDDETVLEIIGKNPFNGEDLKAFERAANHQLMKEAHGIIAGEEAKDQRQRTWTLHIQAKKIRGAAAGVLLGLGLGAATIEDENPLVRFVVPAGLAATVVRLIDMTQFNSRARRAVPEFFDYSKFYEKPKD